MQQALRFDHTLRARGHGQWRVAEPADARRSLSADSIRSTDIGDSLSCALIPRISARARLPSTPTITSNMQRCCCWRRSVERIQEHALRRPCGCRSPENKALGCPLERGIQSLLAALSENRTDGSASAARVHFAQDALLVLGREISPLSPVMFRRRYHFVVLDSRFRHWIRSASPAWIAHSIRSDGVSPVLGTGDATNETLVADPRNAKPRRKRGLVVPRDRIELPTRGFSRTSGTGSFQRKSRRLGPFKAARAAHLPQPLVPIVKPRTTSLRRKARPRRQP
jgi:hypothetical protein